MVYERVILVLQLLTVSKEKQQIITTISSLQADLRYLVCVPMFAPLLSVEDVNVKCAAIDRCFDKCRTSLNDKFLQTLRRIISDSSKENRSFSRRVTNTLVSCTLFIHYFNSFSRVQSALPIPVPFKGGTSKTLQRMWNFYETADHLVR